MKCYICQYKEAEEGTANCSTLLCRELAAVALKAFQKHGAFAQLSDDEIRGAIRAMRPEEVAPVMGSEIAAVRRFYVEIR